MRSLVVGSLTACLVLTGPAIAQAPKRGGELKAAITTETNTTDCHAGVSFTVVHHLAPHYSFLLRHDPEKFPAISGDLAEAWTVSPDGLTYTFKLKDGVRFHDGGPLTSADVVASYKRIGAPPPGVNSVRKGTHAVFASIEAPDAATVVFRLKSPDSSMLTEFASPWNCIYSAKKLIEDPHYPSKEVMGSGPFKFVSRRAGQDWVGERFEGYHVAGQPYLDRFRLLYIAPASVATSLQGGAIDGEFRFVSPGQRDNLVKALGDKATVQETSLSSAIMIAFNVEKPPFNDVRVRRALSMALDRRGVETAMRKISGANILGGFLRPGSEFALPDAELEKILGYGRDAEAARKEARRLLAEAGVPNLKFKLTNRKQPDPFETHGLFAVDQWRRIGVTVEQETVPTPVHIEALTSGNFEVTVDSLSDYIDEPTLLLSKFLSVGQSPPPRNPARYTDPQLDQLYTAQRQAKTADERRSLLRQMEARLHAQAYFAPVFWGQRIVVLPNHVKGWKALPSHFLNQSFATVWLDR
jgi:peptide/nickel transport system substrate-binding protein